MLQLASGIHWPAWSLLLTTLYTNPCVCSQEQISKLVSGALAERVRRVRQAGTEMLQTWLQDGCGGSIVNLVAKLCACPHGKPALVLWSVQHRPE